MNFASELNITLSKENDRKVIRNSSLSMERYNWLSIYEEIEKINDKKKQSNINNINIDIQLLLRSLI